MKPSRRSESEWQGLVNEVGNAILMSDALLHSMNHGNMIDYTGSAQFAYVGFREYID